MSKQKAVRNTTLQILIQAKFPRKNAAVRNRQSVLWHPTICVVTSTANTSTKGKKSNARKEDAQENYLSLIIFRFYIRCPRCSAEITYKTDSKNRITNLNEKQILNQRLIPLFIATNIYENSIIWKAFFPTTLNTGHGPEFEGVIICLFHLSFPWNDKTRALKEAFHRQNLPNMMNLIATPAIVVALIYLQGTLLLYFFLPYILSIPRGNSQVGPIKLFYTSDMPLMLQSALTSNFFLLSQMIFNRYPDNLVKLIRVWESNDGFGQLNAISELAY